MRYYVGMKKQPIVRYFVPLLVALLMLPFVGCETESTSQAYITVTPPDATLHRGESVELNASGWSNYHWSLSNTDIGWLNRPTGDTVIYTSRSSSNTTQTITVFSDYNVLTGTNTEATALVAEALITHVP
jgi:hypothetical protein